MRNHTSASSSSIRTKGGGGTLTASSNGTSAKSQIRLFLPISSYIVAYVIQYQKCSQAVSFSKTIQKSICQIPFRRAIGPLLLLLLLHTDVCPPQFPITDLRAKREGYRERQRETDRQLTKKSYIASKSHSSEYNSGSLPVICKGSQPCTEREPD